MINFSGWLDLPLVFGFIIATALLLYIILDGFDLGCGILFPFAPSDSCRTKIVNAIAPFWDGNETWLVMAGGGLLAAFPVAYAIIMPALYLPIIIMVLGLVFRGVAFEFRFKATGADKPLWDAAFHAGSLLAAFMQGVVIGNFVQGFTVTGRAFSGGPLAWANGFAMLTGLGIIAGYGLLGATWLIWKCDGETQAWARRAARYMLCYVGSFMLAVAVCTLIMDARVNDLWATGWLVVVLLSLAIATCITATWRYSYAGEVMPFITSIMIFFIAYFALGLSYFPWMVPFHFTIWQAAAVDTSLSIILIGVVIFLPIILAYTGYSYYVFRGKTSDKPYY